MIQGLTVITQVAFLPLPSFAVQVMVAVPIAFAVTFPTLLTVATDVLLEDQLTAMLEASTGKTTAVSVPLLPTVQVSVLALSLIEVTGLKVLVGQPNKVDLNPVLPLI